MNKSENSFLFESLVNDLFFRTQKKLSSKINSLNNFHSLTFQLFSSLPNRFSQKLICSFMCSVNECTLLIKIKQNGLNHSFILLCWISMSWLFHYEMPETHIIHQKKLAISKSVLLDTILLEQNFNSFLKGILYGSNFLIPNHQFVLCTKKISF